MLAPKYALSFSSQATVLVRRARLRDCSMGDPPARQTDRTDVASLAMPYQNSLFDGRGDYGDEMLF